MTMENNKSVLYITYDGLTDPLGQSQILPYLMGLSRAGYKFTILSFEKKDRYLKEGDLIRQQTKQYGITWVPLSFSTSPPVLSKFYDAARMRRKALQLQQKYNFQMVHCRSYVAADIGLTLKRKFGIKFFFDMRGFWADEKREGSWNTKNPLYKIIYSYYKSKEAQYLRNADYIISLTKAGLTEMKTWPSFNNNVPVRVIPCCVDMDLFTLTDFSSKLEARQNLGITEDRFVLSYLGSIGTWYMLGEMLLFFRKLKVRYPNALFLILTHSNIDQIYSKARSLLIESDDLIIREATRIEVPKLLKASDVNISFIRPVYSKKSSSPTKLGEVLSLGIPVIVNAGVGDVEQIVNEAKAGYVMDDFSEDTMQKAINAIPTLLALSAFEIRSKINNIYSLENGIGCYLDCYKRILP